MPNENEKQPSALDLLREAFEQNDRDRQERAAAEKTEVEIQISETDDENEDDLPLMTRLSRGFEKLGFKGGENVGK